MLDSEYFKIEKVNSWKQLLSIYDDFSSKEGTWVFRGEGNPKNHLQSSLERVTSKFGIRTDEIPEIELKLLREFKRRLHHYSKDIPAKYDFIEWFSLMQHYGAPTRLLDWTYSLFVATYFAIEDCDYPNCVIWAIQKDDLGIEDLIEDIEPSLWMPREDILNEKSLQMEYGDNQWVIQNHYIKTLMVHPISLVCSVNPFRMNERLTIQQGLFLYPGDISKAFEENISVNAASKEKLIQIIIKVNLPTKREFIYNLHRMNINRATLFPGLVGFSESLRTSTSFHEIFSPLDIGDI